MTLKRMKEERYWTVTRKREICYNLGYPEFHKTRNEARQDMKGMKAARYKDLDLVHVAVLPAEQLHEIKRQLAVARKALEEIEDAQTTLGQDPDVLAPVKSRAETALLNMVEVPETKRKGR